MSERAETVLASVLRACAVIAINEPEHAERLRHLALTPGRQTLTWRIAEIDSQVAFLVADVALIDDEGRAHPVVGIDAAALLSAEQADEKLAQVLATVNVPDDISGIDGTNYTE